MELSTSWLGYWTSFNLYLNEVNEQLTSQCIFYYEMSHISDKYKHDVFFLAHTFWVYATGHSSDPQKHNAFHFPKFYK